jgi:Flp pilus assembly pilin Flp
MKIREFFEDERGIETRVLVFILAAVVLVLLITVITGVMNQATDMITDAIGRANETMNMSM